MGRGALAGLAAMVGGFGVAFSLAQSLGQADAALAHGLAPYDGRVTARLALSLAGAEATPTERRRSDRLAREALRQDPTAVVAASTLGMNAEVHGLPKQTRSFFTFAEKLSRRDSPTQLWRIENAVSRGDVDGALRHYDIALRTSPKLSPLLFPVLATASADPAIRGALVRTLVGKPRWSFDFTEFAATENADPRSTAALFLQLQRAGVAPSESARARTVNVLVAKAGADEGWRYYAATKPGIDRRRSRDPRFTAGIGSPSVFDWQAQSQEGVTTSIQNGAFDFFVPATAGGALLTQAQLLPPGAYRLSGRSMNVEGSPDGLPHWVLTCADARELGRVALSTSADGAFSGAFTVPPGCPTQTLALVARPSDTASGLSGQITEAWLAPAR